MANGLEMFSENRLSLLKETVPGKFNPTVKPRLMHSLISTYQNNEQRDSQRPQGFNAVAWNAILEQTVGLNNEWKPDYGQLDVLLEMLCGEPTSTDTSTPGQKTMTYILPITGSRDISTYTGEFGRPDRAQQLLYSLLQSLEWTSTRGNSPAISGNANMLFLQPGGDKVRMSNGTNETDLVTITGSPTGGTFTLSVGIEETDPIAYDATPEAVQAALEDLANVGAGNVTVSGTSLSGGLTVVFIGELASLELDALTADDQGLTGGSTPTVAIVRTKGVPGTWKLDPRLPVLPQHISVRKAATFAGLASAPVLKKVHEITVSHNNLADPFMFFNEGQINPDAHVDSAEQEHNLDISMAWDPNGDSAAVKANAMKSPSEPEFWQITARHPGGVYRWDVIGCYSVGDPIDMSAAGNVYACKFPMKCLINDEISDGGVDGVVMYKLTVPVP